MVYATDEELARLDEELSALCDDSDDGGHYSELCSDYVDHVAAFEPDVQYVEGLREAILDRQEGVPTVPSTPQVEEREVSVGPVRPTAQQSTGWCFTLNNPIVSGEALMELLKRGQPKYVCFQLESGERGTRHFQGYVLFPKKVRFLRVRELFGDSYPHLEKARGSPQQNRDYCSKEPRLGGPWVFGECPRQGRRTDLEAVARKVLDGQSMREVAVNEPLVMLRYSKGLQALSRYRDPPELFREVEVRLYVGPTGAGKTHAALAECGYDPKDVYVKGTDGWFDNYIGQPCVVLDDFAGKASKISLAETLRLLDRYRYQVPVKGGFEWFTPKLIIVTSNLHPRLWYEWEKRELQYAALQRRFHEVVEFRLPLPMDEQGNCFVNRWGFIQEPRGVDYWINYERCI